MIICPCRDLKPENILYETDAKDSAVKVIDFGTATLFGNVRHLRQRLGTVFFVSESMDRHTISRRRY
jgi:calcium-dependent protein kinase